MTAGDAVNEGIAVETVETCLLCGGRGVSLYRDTRDLLFAASGAWSYLRCPTDGHVWLSPRPRRTELDKIYANYYTHADSGPPRRMARLLSTIERGVRARHFGYDERVSGVIKNVSALVPMASDIGGAAVMWLPALPGGRLVDVGCGRGDFLVRMRALGWDVTGVEVDPRAAQVAQQRLGGAVVMESLEEAVLPADSVDAITANHVIEHVHDPLAFLSQALRILRPGGRVVVTTPNTRSVGHRLFRRHWRGLEPPRHLHLFSPWNLRSTVEGAGFTVQTCRTIARAATEIWVFGRLARSGGLTGGLAPNISARLRLEGLAFRLCQHMLCAAGPDAGEESVLIAAKPGGRGHG